MLKLSIRLEVKKIGFISCIFRNCNSHICSQLRSYIRPHKDLKSKNGKKMDKIPDKQTPQELNFAKYFSSTKDWVGGWE